VKAAQPSSLAPGHHQGLFQGLPTDFLAADGHQDVGKQAVVLAGRQLLSAPLSRRRAGLELVRRHGVQ
jgi:hypothetical protein